MNQGYKSEERKKVLFFITKSNFGGAQKYVYDLARSLNKETYDCGVILGGTGLLVERLNSVHIRTITISTLGRDVSIVKDIVSFFKLISILRKERPHVFHINSSKAGGIGALAGRIAMVPNIVFTAHAWAFNENRNFLSKKIIKILHWITVMLAHKTITVSEAVRKQMSDVPFVKNKITVVYPGIDTPNFLSKKDAQEKLGIRSDVFAIGTIAELHPIKGLTYAFDALKTVSFPFSYTVIGEGGLKDELNTLIQKDSRLLSSVSLKGFLKDAPCLLTAFDMFILPSLSEAFGYVLLEAGLAKVPIVASSVGGIPEIIQKDSGTLVESKSSDKLQKAIESVYTHQKESELNAEKLYTLILEKFSTAKMVENTIAVYNKN
jgi:glycosyltransferase involved in cell wall biosynthesis